MTKSPFRSLVAVALAVGSAVTVAAQQLPGTVLPNGRRITPAGHTILLDPFPFTMAVRPDGRQVVSASIGWPYALNVIDDPGAPSEKLHQFPASAESTASVQVSTGLAYSPDGRLLYDSTGDSGAIDLYDTATWKRVGSISLNGASDGHDYSQSYSGALALSTDGKTLYALDQANWRVVAINIASHSITSAPTGVEPMAIALSPGGDRLYVTNTGLFEYRLVGGLRKEDPIGTGLHFPPTGYPSAAARNGTNFEGHEIPALGDENSPRGSSLWTYDVSDPHSLRITARLRLGAPIQETPGGVIGGAAPVSIAADQEHVYVSLEHEDSVAVISPDGARQQRSIALSPFAADHFKDHAGRPLRGIGPYGLALSGQRLFVAESGIDAVAVIDTVSGSVLGHVPTAWYPVAAAVAPGGYDLLVLTNKGRGAGPNFIHGRHYYIGELEHGSLSTASMAEALAHLTQSTTQVIENNQFALQQSAPPLPPIHHVFLIIRENRTFDEVLGDLPGVNGDASLARYGEHGWTEANPAIHNVDVTPNAHALVRRFATSDNFLVNSEVSADGHRWAVGIAPTPFFNVAWTTNYSGRRTADVTSAAPGRRAMFGGADAPMPEDEPEYGSMWEHIADAHLPILNYGEGLELEGSDEAVGTEPEGQRLFLNAPVPRPLFDFTDRRYPTFNLGIPDQYRFAEFQRDFSQRLTRGTLPALTVIRLPGDHTADPRPADSYPDRASYVADNDLALGKIVDLISHSRIWKSSATFVIEDDAQSGVDHVDAHRSVLLVISPWTRRGFVSHTRTNMGSVQRSMYEWLGVGPLNLIDALSADFRDMFSAQPDLAPFTAVPSDERVFDPARARTAHPRNAAEARALLDCDDPAEIAPTVDHDSKP